MSQAQNQPLLASVMNLSPLVRLFFFFSRSAFSRCVVCVFEVCVFETPKKVNSKEVVNGVKVNSGPSKKISVLVTDVTGELINI